MPVEPSLTRLLAAACGAWLLAIAPSLGAKPVLPSGLADDGASAIAPALARTNTTAATPSADEPTAQYDATTHPLPPNVPSLGFAASGTGEFGDLVRLDGTLHVISGVTVTMSSWAIHSDYPGSSPLGFTHPLTLRIYSVDRSGPTPKPGTILANVTQAFLIPWRPEPDPASTSPLRPWKASDGNYYAGLACNLTFDLSDLVVALPDEVILGVSFNTQHYGAAPIGVAGPYNSLNLGVTDQLPRVGTDANPDAVFWQTAHPGNYSDGGLGGLNVFRQDTGWTPYRPAFRVHNSLYGGLAEAAIRLRALHGNHRKIEGWLRDADSLTADALARTFWDGNSALHPTRGRHVFDFLAEAADVLLDVADHSDGLALESVEAIFAFLQATNALSQSAVADAILADGDTRRITRAQRALEDAADYEAEERFEKAIDELGRAWREAQLALE